MTDRELLELAAKGAGIKSYRFGDAVYPHSHVWTPLTDDGDALLLAVRLNLTIKIMGDHVKVGWRGCGAQWIGEEAPLPSELPAATRRAIVRAAAEIGRKHD